MDKLGEECNGGKRPNMNKVLRIPVILFAGLLLTYSLLVTLKPIDHGRAEGLEGKVSNASKSGTVRRLLVTDTTDAPTAPPDLAITKTHITPFLHGAQGVYSITVTNLGDQPTGEITLIDNLPNGLTLFGSSGSDWVCNGTTIVTCIHPNTSTVATGDSWPNLYITVTVGKLSVSTITNTATITHTITITYPSDNDLTNNTDTDAIALTADLAVVKSVTPANPVHNGQVVYSLVVTNHGPDDAPSVVLTDTLPAQVTYNSSSPGVGIYNSSTGRWAIGNLVNGASVSMLITATVKSNACGVVGNTTNGLTSNLVDGNSANNASTATFTAGNTCVVGHVKSLATSLPINLANVTLRDNANHIFSTQTSASGIYTFTDTSSPIISGTVAITATKTGYQPNTIFPSIISSTVNNVNDIYLTPSVELVVSKTDNRTTVVPGQTFTYTISITNSGLVTATSVVITDNLSSQLTYLTNSLIGQSDVISRSLDHTRIWTLTNGLDPGEHIVFTLRSQVAGTLNSGTVSVTNTVHISSPEPEGDENNNVATDVDYTPNVSIIKSVTPTQAQVNSRFTFTIQLQNNAKVNMTNVSLSDTFPSYLTYYSASITKGTYGYNTSTRTFSVSIGTMVPNENVTITIYMTVNSTVSTTQTLTNYATVYFTHGDTSLSQNSNSVSYRVIGSSSLPGTGGLPGQVRDNQAHSMAGFWAAAVSAAILLFGGLIAAIYGLRLKQDQPEWAAWSVRIGSLLFVVGIMFSVIAWGLLNISGYPDKGKGEMVVSQPISNGVETQDVIQPATQVPGLSFQDYKTLPDYPVPTPKTTQAANLEKPADLSSPVRLLIPSLGVDAIIKYVPYDGFSWLISGLQNEIAWMGDTSWPGLGSNTALAGHVTLRNGADGPFRYLETLKRGASLTVFTEKFIYTYQVQELKVVNDSDMSVVKPSDQSILTLITCTAWDNALGHYIKRLIVIADLVDTQPIVIRGN
jgi:LPXTG-site transpeptidase (sortase) family protein